MASNTPSITLDDVSVTAPAPKPAAPAAQPAPTSGTSSYKRRRIAVTFLPTSGKQQTYQGLRCLLRVERGTAPSGAKLMLRMEGLPLSDMNSFSRAGRLYYIAPEGGGNKIAVSVGTDDGPMTQIFYGQVILAYPDFRQQPDAAFVVQAVATYPMQLIKVPPQSFNRTVSVEDALKQILKSAGVTVKNNGVNVQLTNPYFQGSTWAQVNAAIRAADCTAYYDDVKKELIIAPKFGGPSSGGAIEISPATGLIGYPEFQMNRIFLRVMYAPNVLTKPSDQIRVKSQLEAANGLWNASQVDYELSSETPNGPWELQITANPLGLQGQSG